VVAYLPACVDKLLGIYLLARAVKDMFILDNLSKVILLIAGSLTVICAVMMALIQHNIKKLLGFHAVSQVGYMVLGVGCATPLGLAGGLFHMVNNAIYKSCLFLGAGNVEKTTHTAEIDNLGGLGKFMPLTFFTTLIASLSISGIPPFNGFVSKWMVYQGLIDFISSSNSIILKFVISLSLAAALIGSGLTLASFLKLNSGIFLGRREEKVKEVKSILLFSPLVLSFFCIIFGIFSYSTILPFIKKGVGEFSLGGLWNSSLATNLIILGVIFGLIVFKIMSAKKTRVSSAFIGGEELSIEEEAKISPFYDSIKEIKPLKGIYNFAEKKLFDIYELLSRFVSLFVKLFRYLHNGALPTYLVWCLVAMLGLFFVFFK
jgi:formate hydrogenlyase subunit 3/multisubunit Na+/H+ antiporter MnhD subunit